MTLIPKPASSDAAGQTESGHIRPVLSGYVADDQVVDNAVARLILNAISDRLPHQFARAPNGRIITSRYAERPRQGETPLVPSYLFGINWASTGPGLEWPEHYHIGYFPRFDVFIVTASQDLTDVFGYYDKAICWFPASGNPAGDIQLTIIEWWQAQALCLQERWEELIAEGLVSSGAAETWADIVWPESETNL